MVYKPTSFYGKTPIEGRFLGHYVHRPIPPHPDDRVVSLGHRYVERPDLLALDVYGDSDLWWVIPQRNGMEDPIFDMTYGRSVVVPELQYVLGIVR